MHTQHSKDKFVLCQQNKIIHLKVFFQHKLLHRTYQLTTFLNKIFILQNYFFHTLDLKIYKIQRLKIDINININMPGSIANGWTSLGG